MKRRLGIVAVIILLALALALPVLAATTPPSWMTTETQNRLNSWFLRDQRRAIYSAFGDLASAGGYWSTLGNAGTTAGTHYVGTSDSIDLVFKTDATEVFRLADGAAATWTADTGTDLFNALVGNVKIGNGTPGVTLNGEDLYVEGTFEVDSAVLFDSTSDMRGNVSDGGGTWTLADDGLVDGQADAIQLTVQGFTTQTSDIFVVEETGGGDRFTVDNSGNAEVVGTLAVGGDITLENAETIGNSENGLVEITTPNISIGDSHVFENGDALSSGIGSGDSNEMGARWSYIGGGTANVITATTPANDARYSIIGGGQSNEINITGDLGTIAGGYDSTITGTGSYGFIGGGYQNSITSADSATVAGGAENDLSAAHASVMGGYDNDVSGAYGSILGGMDNGVTGDYALAAGRRAQANHDGAMVFADSTDADYTSTAADTINFRFDTSVFDADIRLEDGFVVEQESATEEEIVFTTDIDVVFGVTTTVTGGVIPGNANVVDWTLVVYTSFDGSGTDIIICGVDGDTDKFIDDLDASAAGRNEAGDGADTQQDEWTTSYGDIGSADKTVQCQYTDENNNASAGGATFILLWSLD